MVGGADMGRQDEFEDDGRMIADMSGLESTGLFGGRSHNSWRKRKQERRQDSAECGVEDIPFTWQERARYIVMALSAALLIGVVLLSGIALVIWLFTLYA